MSIPHIVLASNGEDEKIVQEYKEVLVGEGKLGVWRHMGRCIMGGWGRGLI
jgi:hypothetical protein